MIKEESKILINNISYAYTSGSSRLEVLNGISFDLGPGEVVAILGPSGCGKSTLLKCIAGLIPFDTGSVSIAGLPPHKALEAKAIGFSFQDAALLAWRSVARNILLPSELGPNDTSPSSGRRIDELLALTGLAQFRDYLPAQLSGGMKQRVSLARALLLRPKLLLLDEPFGSLDLLTRTQLGAEFGRIVHSMDVPTVIVTHSIEEALFLGTRVVVLSSRPAHIVEVVECNFPHPRELSLLEGSDFLALVGHCRSSLLKVWGSP